jgi:uncharacterized protein
MNDALSNQRTLVAALAASLGPATEVHETHISWVLVAGAHAYKFKKAVRFDFLDFSTLEARLRYCREELRLNGMLAPELYLEVVAVAGTPQHPLLGTQGAAIEYAVKMRAFDQRALWTHRLEHGLLGAADVDGLAELVARFHDGAAVAPAESPWCTPAALQAIADDTLAQILRLLPSPHERQSAAELRDWEYRQRAELRDAFLQRKAAGHIRECHGDLHSGNILTLNGKVEAFDRIEFNDSLRWIDVLNDIAFACMDLRFRQRADLAARLLNRYLELSGDYEGLPGLRYYEVHRALIRCKIALLRQVQCVPDSREAQDALHEARAYLAYAAARIRPVPGAVLITHGFSGSGKSTVAGAAVEALDAIQLRSDVERKRMHGIAPAQTADGLYAAEVTRRTYERLLTLARLVAQAGWCAIVDAAFLRRAQREPFRELAAALGVPFRILDVRASEATMRARLIARRQEGRDASDAGPEVLALQLDSGEAFAEDEKPFVVGIDNESAVSSEMLRMVLNETP